MNRYVLFLLCSLALAGCGGDPIANSIDAVEKIAKRWQAAKEIDAPDKRLAEYRDILVDLKKVPERYPETPTGQRLATGGDVGSVSIKRFEARTERLAERATCYAEPSADCLIPFTSDLFDKKDQRREQSARDLICSQGLEAALAAMESKRINRRLYADELIQLGFAAARCGQPSRVNATIAAYIDAEPLTMAERALKITQVVATVDLKPGWPPAIDELERLLAVAGIDANTKATVALTLLNAHSQLNQPEEAIAKLKFVSDELGFTVSNANETAARLIGAGAVTEGLSLARGAVSQSRFADQSALSSVWTATKYLVANLGIETNGTLSVASVVRNDNLAELLAKPEQSAAAATSVTITKITRVLDEFDPSLWSKDGLRKTQASDAYARIGLLHRKLGNADAAASAFDKADNIVATAGQRGTPSLYRFLVAMADKDIDTMRSIALAIDGYNNPYIDPYIRAAVAANDIEQAIETMAAASPQDAGARFYRTLVQAMIESDKLERLEEVIDAAPQDQRSKAQHASNAIQALSKAGMPARIESLAARYQPNRNAREQEILTEALIQAHANAGNDSEAKALIDTMFTAGFAADASASQFDRQKFMAQNAATQAFRVGLFDYGLALYRQAERRNAMPLTTAVALGSPSAAQLTQILMVAHDYTSPADEEAVVGSVVSYLREQSPAK
ncbi:MAG: hypothetical protein AAGC71_01795 [Pseudomonadota bacterium]